MKKIFLILVLVTFTVTTRSQTRPTGPVLPDVNKMMKMTPAELEAYKKQMLKDASANIKRLSEEANIKVDESLLPDYELQLPSKDLKRLALIPATIPSLPQLSNDVKRSRQQLASLTPKAILDKINKIAAEKNPAQLQSASIAEWYGDNPVAALLLSMESVIKNPDTAIAWNNLAAFFNMSGLEHKAVPILQHWLKKLPGNSLLLNNIGQSYLGLGDLVKAEDYLMQCLQKDSLNPEANRSMAMLCLKKNQPEKAKEFVKKEQQITNRQSTDKQMENTKQHIDLYNIHLNNPRLPKNAYFETIGLSKFKLPPMPERSDDSRGFKFKWIGFNKSVSDEMLFWGTAATPSRETLEQEGKENSGVYYRKAERLLQDLYDNYLPIIPLFNKTELHTMQVLAAEYGKKMGEIICDQPPPNASREVGEAYQKRCCDRKKPVTDNYVKAWNELVKNSATRAIAVWKQYIDGLANIAAICPCGYHKRVVFTNLSQFFGMLAFASGTVRFDPPPTECSSNGLTSEEAEQIIKSSREVDLNCPSWLNFEYDLHVAKVKGDCETFKIEGGEGFVGEFEKNFKTGTSTIAVGGGITSHFTGIVEGELKQLVYITFDNGNNFTDIGIKGTAEVSVGDNPIAIAGGIAEAGGKIAGVEGGYQLGVNSGLKTSLQGKGIIAEFINMTMQFF